MGAMELLMIVAGAAFMAGSVWLLRAVRVRPDGSQSGLMAKRGMSEVVVFMVLGGGIIGLVLIIKAFTG